MMNQKAIDGVISEITKTYKFPLCTGTASTDIPGLDRLRNQVTQSWLSKDKKEAEDKGIDFIEKMTSVLVMSMDRMKKCLACEYFDKCVSMVRKGK